MSQKPYKRRNKFPKLGIQLRLIGAFAGVSALTLMVQAMLLSDVLTNTAATFPTGGTYLVEQVPDILFNVIVYSFVVLLPLTLVVGTLSTFRVAGPIKHFELHLGRLAKGEDPGPCRLRKGDDLQELCEVLNQATATLLSKATAAADTEPASPEPVEREAA